MKKKNVIKNILMIAALGIAIMFFTNVIFAANTAKINVETANLRETADENSRILVQLSLNDEVEILQKTGNWYEVKTKNGTTGYLREDLVEVSGEVKETQNTSEETNTTESNAETTSNEGQETTEASTESTSSTRIVKEDTKLKIVPSINATDIVEVKQNDKVTIIETMGDWICIESGTTKGWIRSDKLMTEEEKAKQDEEAKAEEKEAKQAAEEEEKQTQTTKTMYANSATVNVREEASKDSSIVEQIPLNTAVTVLSEESGWSRVSVNSKEGYIASNLLSASRTQETATSRGSTTTRKKAETTTTEETTTTVSSGKGSTVVETAKNYIGYRYVYGASGPNSFDCSGFTSYVFKLHGVSLSRTAKGQYSNGTAVARADLQPGDLVMFGPSISGINHVGIYIGGGQIVHAANPSRGVTIDTINSGYYNNNYVGARRVI